MKIILILLSIWILYNKRNTIKSFLKNQETIIKEISDSMNNLNKTIGNKEITKGATLLVSIFLVLTYILFYILSAIFVNSFVFTIISVIFIINTLRSIDKIMKILNEDYSAFPNKFLIILNFVVETGYVFYVLYQVFLQW